MEPRLCIGTAQFGMNYGISNKLGKVKTNNAREILNIANNTSIEFIDTAKNYGDAEKVLGKTLPKDNRFRIVSKLPTQKKTRYDEKDVERWDRELKETLKNIGITKLDSLLLHEAKDLAIDGADLLLDWMKSIKDRGMTERTGISIYDKNDLSYIDANALDIVQLPLSIYDQRMLVNGTIDELSEKGCAIHIRSIYLQGLIPMKANEWPEWVSERARAHHMRLEEIARENQRTMVELAIEFAKKQTSIEAVVVGICTERQVKLLLDIWNKQSVMEGFEWDHWKMPDESIVDIRQWPT